MYKDFFGGGVVSGSFVEALCLERLNLPRRHLIHCSGHCRSSKVISHVQKSANEFPNFTWLKPVGCSHRVKGSLLYICKHFPQGRDLLLPTRSVAWGATPMSGSICRKCTKVLPIWPVKWRFLHRVCTLRKGLRDGLAVKGIHFAQYAVSSLLSLSVLCWSIGTGSESARHEASLSLSLLSYKCP